MYAIQIVMGYCFVYVLHLCEIKCSTHNNNKYIKYFLNPLNAELTL